MKWRSEMKKIIGFLTFSMVSVLINFSVYADVYQSSNIKLNEFSDVVGDRMKVTLDDVTREVNVTVNYSADGGERTVTTTADKDVENGRVSYQAFYYQSRGKFSVVRLYMSVDDNGKLNVRTSGWLN